MAYLHLYAPIGHKKLDVGTGDLGLGKREFQKWLDDGTEDGVFL